MNQVYFLSIYIMDSKSVEKKSWKDRNYVKRILNKH